MNPSVRLWMFLVAVVAGLASSEGRATVIVFDGFNGITNGSFLTGRNPSSNGGVNEPGGTWAKATSQFAFQGTTTAGYGDPLPGSFGKEQGGSAISIASAGPYTKPTLLRISADVAPRDLVGDASAGRGIALGFYNTVGNSQQFSQNRFTGLVLDAAGNLNLVQDPNLTGFFGAGSLLGTPIAFVGTWDASALRLLSFDIDTTTGGISNISLEGSSATYSFSTSLFTDAATAYAGMYTSSATTERYGALDNFQVVMVPEPSPGLVSAVAFACVLLMRRGAASASIVARASR